MTTPAKTVAPKFALTTASAGDKTMVIPMMVGGGKPVRDSECPDRLTISGADAFHPDVFIKTTRQELDQVMDEITLDIAKRILPNVWRAIKAADKDAIYRRGGKKWDDFCNQIVLYYIARFRVFGLPFPMVELVEED